MSASRRSSFPRTLAGRPSRSLLTGPAAVVVFLGLLATTGATSVVVAGLNAFGAGLPGLHRAAPAADGYRAPVITVGAGSPAPARVDRRPQRSDAHPTATAVAVRLPSPVAVFDVLPGAPVLRPLPAPVPKATPAPTTPEGRPVAGQHGRHGRHGGNSCEPRRHHRHHRGHHKHRGHPEPVAGSGQTRTHPSGGCAGSTGPRS